MLPESESPDTSPEYENDFLLMLLRPDLLVQ